MVLPDQAQAVVTYVGVLAELNPPVAKIALRGLDASATHLEESLDRTFRGDALLRIWLPLDLPPGIL